MNWLGGSPLRIRRIFVDAGITDPLETLEHMAALLLMQMDRSLTSEDGVHVFRAVPDVILERIKPLVEEELKDPNGLGPGGLFRMLVHAWVSSAGAAGQYPTPQGIPQLMARVTKAVDGDLVLDLACGSGSLLAAAAVQAGVKPSWVSPSNRQVSLEVTGVEPDPAWARIAWANAVLHGIQRPQVLTKPAERLSGLGTFQVVLTHPPVGLELNNTFDLGGGERVRSETALTHMAVQALDKNGRASMLVPTHLLDAPGTAEATVRLNMVTVTQLRAVVTLPERMQYGFSRAGSHLLFLEKTVPADRRTWFIQLPDPTGRLRPEPPGWWGDLLVALLDGRPSVTVTKLEGGNLRAARWRQLNGTDEPVGYVLEPDTVEAGQPETGRFSAVEMVRSESGTVLLATVVDEAGQVVGRLLLRAGGQPTMGVGSREAVLRKYLGLQSGQRVPGPGERILVDVEPGAALCLTPTLEIVGITGSPATVKERAQTELLPAAWLPKQRRSEPRGTPEEIIVRLYQKQRQLQERVERLFSTFAEPAILNRLIPPPTVYSADEPQRELDGLFSRLSNDQAKVWQQMREARQDDIPKIAKAVLPVQLEAPEREGALRLEATLELLRRMGGVLPITLEGELAYRLATTWDRWDDWDVPDEATPQTPEETE